MRFRLFLLAASSVFLSATQPVEAADSATASLPLPALVERLTWGITPAELDRARQLGAQAYIEAQLRPDPGAALPAEVQRRIDALSISRLSAQEALIEAYRIQMAIRGMDEGPAKADARKMARKLSAARASETARRITWQALYSPNQLQQQMTWFWLNHFNVYAGKGHIGLALGDYEARTIRPRALGKFRDLLEATMRAPAMIIYLDNQRNRAGRLNENYARELMELHTLGVHAGYTQKDVQELARALTGLEVDYGKRLPRMKRPLKKQVVREGGFLFNPKAHDYGDKILLGHRIKGAGLAEIHQIADLLARHPATARHISLKLAQYFVADRPPEALVEAMARTFLASDGDIAETMRTMFASQAFADSLGQGKFKDPMHYVYSALRLTYSAMPPVARADAVNGWLSRMGQPLFRRQTPDGYPSAQSDWSGSGQMTTRFDFARQVALHPQGFYRNRGDKTKPDLPALPRLAALYKREKLYATLAPATRQAVEQAKSVQDANLYLLSSPEFMRR
ncbi:DUF1800 domain-containing protein [Bordetella petrii]|uniref:DUF1800 domain-containing protein n=1 Tax=Bordetella petrii TaxID=94624 RepID=UPI00325B3E2A